MNPENFILQIELPEIAKKISNSNSAFNRSLLSLYLEVDLEFAKQFIIQLNLHILRIINDFTGLKNFNDKFVYLFSAYVFILYIPIEESKFLPLTDYEPLLDFTIELSKVKKFDDSTVPCSLIVNILCLPFVKISQSGLNKILLIIKSYYNSKVEYYFSYSMYGIILSNIHYGEDEKSQKNRYAEEVFKLVFHFAQSKNFECSNLVPLLFMFRGAVFRRIFDFCVQHQLLSKTHIFLIRKNLDFIDALN